MINFSKPLKIVPIASYTENGCNIFSPHPDWQLYRIDYWDSRKSSRPGAGFNSMETFDWLEAAEKLAYETFGKRNVVFRLKIPTLVFHVES